MSRIAYVKAHAPEVRAFARQLLIDHREMAINLDNFALERGYLIAWEIQPEMASAIEHLRTLDGPAFDRAYMEQMVADHKAAVELFETAADDEKLDLDLRSYAKRILPTLRDHLKQAQTIESKLSD